MTIASRNRLLLVSALALLVVPVLLDLGLSDRSVAFRYSAADAFYYHTIARNIGIHGRVSFDQTHPTNGFHPLWQIALAAQYAVLHRLGVSDSAYLSASIVLGVTLIAAALYCLWRAYVSARGEVPLAFGLLPTGVYALCLAPVWAVSVYVFHAAVPQEGRLPLYGTLWSFANGMESSLALCAFGMLALSFVQERAVLTGLLGSLLVLSRLDHVFIAAVVVGSVVWRAYVARRHRAAVAALAAFGAPIAAYLVVNMWYAAAWLPMSGAAKSSFPWPVPDHLFALGFLLRHPVELFDSPGRLFRVSQLLIPLAAATYVGVRIRSGPHDIWQRFLRCVAAGVAALAIYTFSFVKPFDVGHWYFPVSVLFVTLVVAEFWRPRFGAPAIAGLAALSLVVFVVLHRRPDYHTRYSDFYFREAPLLKARYQDPPLKLVESDDGIIAFSTGFAALSGFGLTLDRGAYDAWRTGTLAALAYARGFDRIATVAYRDPARGFVSASSSPDEIRQFMAMSFIRIGSPEAYVFSVDYLAPSGRFAVIRFAPK